MRPSRSLTILAAAAAAVATLALPANAAAEELSVSIVAPEEGAVVTGSVGVEASTTGAATSVAFDRSTDDGASWTSIGVDTTPGDGWTASWASAWFDGPALLRATATDGTSEAEDIVAVTVDNEAPTVSISLSNPAFSPNGDLRKDKTVVTAVLSEPGDLTVTVEDEAGRVVKTLLDGARRSGTVHLEWRGLVAADGGGYVRAPDGRYTVLAELRDEAGNAGTDSADLVLDTKAPTFLWRSIWPEPVTSTGTTLHLRFTTSDGFSARLAMSFTAFDQLGAIRTVSGLSRLTGQRELPWLPRYPGGAPLIPGPYEIRMKATDEAANTRVSNDRRFRVHRPVYTAVFNRVDGAGKRVALTFDDCLYADAWSRILNTLAARGAKATFFCNGGNVGRFPGQAARTVAAGHTIGSHTSDHALLTTLDYAAIRARMLADRTVWWSVAGWTPAPYFRPPYGAYDAEVLQAAGSSAYLRTVMWDVDPADWSTPGASVIVSRVVSASRAGSIVVLHVKPQTADALNGIITGLRNKGLEPVSLARLFRAAGFR